MKDTEFKVMPVDRPLKNTVMCHETIKLTMVAQLARDFTQGIMIAQHSNVVQGKEAKLLSNKEVVAKACDLADEMFTEFRKRGWLLDMPSLDELAKDTSSAPGFKVAS